jgi:anti-sigma B factor antagonist
MRPPPQRCPLPADEVNGTTAVRLSPRDLASVGTLEATLFGLAEASRGREVLVDFAGIDYFNAAALTVLLRLQKQLVASGRRLGLCNLRPAVAEVFEVTRLDRLFDIRPGAARRVQEGTDRSAP